MQLDELTSHLRRGGAATLNHPATYSVAAGSVIAPARYAGRSGSEFVFEKRYIDGEFRDSVLIDSKGSQSNRSEEALVLDRDAAGTAASIPAIAVSYGERRLLDLELPHRFIDAHIRNATQDGKPVVTQDWFRAMRDATAADLSPLFTTAPAALAFGVWDSGRKRGQLRVRSHFVSELYAAVAVDQDRVSKRSGARLDPLGQDFHLTPEEFEVLLERQRAEMSPKTVAKLEKLAAKARKDKTPTISAAPLGLGGVPPSTENPAGVSVPEVRRARTYSLAGLRRLRFGGTEDEDIAARAALLGMLLLGAALADADPSIRAYCDLAVPRGEPLLDDEPAELALDIDSCGAFLKNAVSALPERLAWNGQTEELIGDPSLDRGAVDDDEPAE